ncbi:hypothetical protein GWK47_038277 [Chionoecetes opilio]|uniref:Uncharacterized protein n=1 Tax=Chionoecetes opilio TaxID=41210 RepID=A0A8J4YRZ2_CHIOP|nr:hypothetical protein GWK47_038277 [Chionoecetes opilio]
MRGAKSRRIYVVFDVYKETPSKMQNEPTEVQAQGSISRTSTWGQHPAVEESYSVVFPKKGKSHQVPGRRMEKPQHREKNSRARSCMSHVSSSASRSPKSSGKRLLSLSQVKKKQTQRLLLHALHAAESGYKSVIITAEDTDVMVLCLGSAHKIPFPPVFPKCGTKNRKKIPGYHHTEPYTGRQRV